MKILFYFCQLKIQFQTKIEFIIKWRSEGGREEVEIIKLCFKVHQLLRNLSTKGAYFFLAIWFFFMTAVWLDGREKYSGCVQSLIDVLCNSWTIEAIAKHCSALWGFKKAKQENMNYCRVS